MEIQDKKLMEMIAYEAFIRRASEIDLPFMLKGSYVTRQYFPHPTDRMPADLDWIYLEPLSNVLTARNKFDEWAILVTELKKNDGVKYRSFTENQFWRMIDYAMADDFPTVSTDLTCWINEHQLDLWMDVSFNLPIENPPVPLLYKPLQGEPFTIPKTVPLSLQVAWKIHQTLVRPRFKDLFDLMHLVNHPTFNENVLHHVLQALVNECSADNVDFNRFGYFLSYEIDKLFIHNSINSAWDVWRHGIRGDNYVGLIIAEERANSITDVSKLPVNLTEFLAQFKIAMQAAGLNIHLMDKLPSPEKKEKNVLENGHLKNEIRQDVITNKENETKKLSPFLNFIKKYFG